MLQKGSCSFQFESSLPLLITVFRQSRTAYNSCSRWSHGMLQITAGKKHFKRRKLYLLGFPLYHSTRKKSRQENEGSLKIHLI